MWFALFIALIELLEGIEQTWIEWTMLWGSLAMKVKEKI
jgi:hypothetical protein